MKHFSLGLIAFLSCFLWRLEISLHEHAFIGLDWLSYYHWAIPGVVLLFILWATYFNSFSIRKKALFFFTNCCLAYFFFHYALNFLVLQYAGGPSAIFMTFWGTPIIYLLEYSHLCTPILIFSLPLFISIYLKLYQFLSSFTSFLLSLIISTASIPIAAFFTYLEDEHSHAVEIIKYGWINPLLVLSYGILFYKIKLTAE